MLWKDYRLSDNVIDRRTDDITVKDAYLGEVIVTKQRTSGEIWGITATELSDKCAPEIQDQFFYSAAQQLPKFLREALKHDPNISEDQKKLLNAVDHSQPSFLKKLFNPSSCDAQISNFYQKAKQLDLQVSFTPRSVPIENDASTYRPPGSISLDNTAKPTMQIKPLITAKPSL